LIAIAALAVAGTLVPFVRAAMVRAAAPAPSLTLKLEARVKLGPKLVVRGVAGAAGRLVLVVRNANSRVIGRVVRTRVEGAFGAAVPLNSAARPGRVSVSAQLTGAGAFDPARASGSLELVKIEPNFLAALRSPWPVGRPMPVKGRIAFPGRLVLVARSRTGSVYGKTVVTVNRKGPFTSVIRFSRSARPGGVVVTATLRSGSLIARGRATVTLVAGS
jgi:hypothetical protein